MDITKLFDTSYLFQIYPGVGFDWPIRILLLFIFLGAMAIAILADKKTKKAPGIVKKVWLKLQIWGWTSGIFGLILVSFREVGAIYLSQRFWLFLWLLIVFLWLAYILYYWKMVIPQKEERKQESEEYNKWLPKKKK